MDRRVFLKSALTATAGMMMATNNLDLVTRAKAELARRQALAGASIQEQLPQLENQYEEWLRRLFPDFFDLPFAPYHHEFWGHLWKIQPHVRPSAFFSIWPRMGGKSTHMEAGAVALGAREKRRYFLYLCDSQEMSDDHVGNIEAMITSSQVERFYPELSTPRLGKFGNIKGWRRNRLRTASGFTVDAIGLDTAARGVKLEDQRPDGIIFDDIDSETDSIEQVQKKIKIITRAIIPAGSSDVGIWGVQNLVHKDSVFSQLMDGRAQFLLNRQVSGPTPAVRDFDGEYRIEGNRKYFFITQGTYTWPDGMGKERCEQMIDAMGLQAFLIECQHRTDIIAQDKSFREYDERFHVVTEEEVIAHYARYNINLRNPRTGRLQWPKRQNKGRGLDWGTTQKHPTGVIHATRPYIRDPLSDCVFWFGQICRPEWPAADDALTDDVDNPDGNYEMVSPGRIALEEKKLLAQWNITADEIMLSLMSHEASAALATFMQDLAPELKMFYQKWKPKRGSGVPQIQELMVVDKTRPHPIRRDPRTNRPLMGRTRFMIVVAKGQGELYYDQENALRVRQGTNDEGCARLRAEIPEYNEYNTGKKKIFDDVVNAMCGLASRFVVPAAGLTPGEEAEERVPEHLRASVIAELPALDQQRANTAAQHYMWAPTDAEDLARLRAEAGDEDEPTSPYGFSYPNW